MLDRQKRRSCPRDVMYCSDKFSQSVTIVVLSISGAEVGVQGAWMILYLQFPATKPVISNIIYFLFQPIYTVYLIIVQTHYKEIPK